MNKKMKFLNLEKILLLFTIVFIFIFNYQTTGYGNIITNGLIILFIVYELIRILKKGKVKKIKEIITLILFVVICGFSYLYSYNPTDTLAKVKTMIILVFLLISILKFLENDECNFEYFLKIIAFSGILSCVYMFLNSEWKSGIRVDNIIGDSNQVGAYLAYSFSVLFYLYKSKKVKSIYAISGMILIFCCNIISGSRSALLVTFLGAVIFSFMTIKKNKTMILKIIGIVFISIVGLYGLYYLIMNNETLYQIIGNRFVSFFEIISGKQSSINETSTQTRAYLISLAWNMFTRNPGTILFGNGIGYFASYWVSVGGRYAFCHNNYLELLSGVGIIGTILYYYTYIKTLIIQMKEYKTNHSDKSALCLVILIQIFLMHWFVVFYYQKCEMLFLAIMVYLNYVTCLHRKDVLSDEKS